jgi:hypothetical protein
LAYALQEKIRQLGYDSALIDYDPTPIPSVAKHFVRTWLRRIGSAPSYLQRIPRIVLSLMKGGALMPSRHRHKSVGRRADCFASFRKQHIHTTKRSWPSSLQLSAQPPQMDVYVCGSDQIWNPFMCRPVENPGFDPAYFLAFAPAGRRVSYAPSVAIPSIPVDLQAEFARLAGGVRFLSCREESGSQLIEASTHRSVKTVLDPVLLLEASDWQHVLEKPQESTYILCYFLGDGRGYRAFAKELSRQTGLPIRVISSNPDDIDDLGAEGYADIGPAEFIGLVANAKYMCTDSFHGVLFSILFERIFFAFERPGSRGNQSMASRIYSILSRLGLMDRLVSEGSMPTSQSLFIDYGSARLRLALLRADSVGYLRDSLAAALA